MTVHTCVRPIRQAELAKIGVELALGTFTPKPCAALSRGW